MLAVPLGTIGRIARGLEANLLTTLGAVFVGVLTFSGFRVAQAGALTQGSIDKACLGLQVLATALCGYITLLMVTGSDLLGLQAVTYDNEQFTLSSNTFPLFEAGPNWSPPPAARSSLDRPDRWTNPCSGAQAHRSTRGEQRERVACISWRNSGYASSSPRAGVQLRQSVLGFSALLEKVR